MIRSGLYAAGLVFLFAGMAPVRSWADKGEAYVQAGGAWHLSFLKNPQLTYTDHKRLLNAFTPVIETSVGMGATDWLDIAVGGRFLFPVSVMDRDTSAQGFPSGESSYQMLGFHLPIIATVRYSWGKSISAAIATEAGVEVARWSLISSMTQDRPQGSFGISPTSDWSSAFIFGVHPNLEWRHFDHISIYAGPRFVLATTGSCYLGLGLGISYLWGIGLF